MTYDPPCSVWLGGGGRRRGRGFEGMACFSPRTPKWKLIYTCIQNKLSGTARQRSKNLIMTNARAPNSSRSFHLTIDDRRDGNGIQTTQQTTATIKQRGRNEQEGGSGATPNGSGLIHEPAAERIGTFRRSAAAPSLVFALVPALAQNAIPGTEENDILAGPLPRGDAVVPHVPPVRRQVR